MKYIKVQGDINLFSNDNWVNFEKLDRSMIVSELETDKDKVREVKLRYELGEEKGKVIIQELKKIRKILPFDSTKDGYGLAFEVFAISTINNIGYEETIDNYIVHGSNDGGIDAIYWGGEEKIILYQIKIDLISSDPKTKIRNTHNKFINGEELGPNCDDLIKFYKKNESRIINRGFNVYTVSENLVGTFNIKPSYIYEEYFRSKLIVLENNLELVLNVPSGNSDNGEIVYYVTKIDEIIYAYFVDAKKFIDQITNCSGIKKFENIYKYFYDNVRGYVGTNKKIRKTILEDPEKFVKYNNGITITGKVNYEETIGKILIKNPTISNGQQTIMNLIDNYEKIEGINLLIIVKADNNPSIKDKIARYTNEQRKILPIDLLSLNKNVREIQRKIYNDGKYFLDINSTGDKGYRKLIKKIYNKDNVISLSDFCKIYYSTEDKKIGSWKNNISKQIESLLDNCNSNFDVEKSLKVCDTIINFKNYISTLKLKKSVADLLVADIAFMYLTFKYQLSVNDAHEIIRKINNKEFYDVDPKERKSKLIDIYKSNDIVEKLDNVVLEYIETKKLAAII